MLHRRRGFTLIELAFSMALLAIIIAILMPVYERSKEEQRKSTCQNNLKECGVALQLYWNDWDAALPSSVLASAVPGNQPTGAETTSFLTALGENYPPRDGSRLVTWPQILYDHSRNKAKILFCPMEDQHTRVSYWYKYAADLAWRNSNIRAQHEGDYAYNADQIIFYEHTGWHVGDSAGIKNGVMINVAYMDSHVGSIVVRNSRAAYPAKADERSGASAVQLGEPMYYNYSAQTNTYHPDVANYIDPRYYYDKP